MCNLYFFLKRLLLFFGACNGTFYYCCLRMDEMMRGQRGWRELAVLGDKINKFTGMIEGLIWSPRGGDSSEAEDNWAFEEVVMHIAVYLRAVS